MVEDLELLKEEIKEKLTEKRYAHSIGVMNMCEKLAITIRWRCKKSKINRLSA